MRVGHIRQEVVTRLFIQEGAHHTSSSGGPFSAPLWLAGSAPRVVFTSCEGIEIAALLLLHKSPAKMLQFTASLQLVNRLGNRLTKAAICGKAAKAVPAQTTYSRESLACQLSFLHQPRKLHKMGSRAIARMGHTGQTNVRIDLRKYVGKLVVEMPGGAATNQPVARNPRSEALFWGETHTFNYIQHHQTMQLRNTPRCRHPCGDRSTHAALANSHNQDRRKNTTTHWNNKQALNSAVD